ncbi:hypothetical protein [Leifsonia xyli]|nr:hypothetical protein [Leifsonia xyli]
MALPSWSRAAVVSHAVDASRAVAASAEDGVLALAGAMATAVCAAVADEAANALPAGRTPRAAATREVERRALQVRAPEGVVMPFP